MPWSISQAQKLFSIQQDNEDAALVDIENKTAAHWYRRWLFLTEQGCPIMIAYDAIAVRARKSARTIRAYVRVYTELGDEMEQYEPLGIAYLTAALTRKDPDAFLDEAMRNPNTTIETLCVQFEAADGGDEPRDRPPYHRTLWGAGRCVAILPIVDREQAAAHLAALTEIFQRCGVE